MIPSFQVLPTPSLPFYNTFGMNSVQPTTTWVPLFYNFCNNPQIKMMPFNFYPKTFLTQPLATLSQERSTDASFHKIENFQDLFQNKSTFTNNQENFKQSKHKYDQSQKQSNYLSKKKRTIPKNRITKCSQNKNRNIIPSVIQQIFSYLSKPNKSKSIVSKVFSLCQTSQCEVSIQKYFYFIKQIKEKLNHYLNIGSLSVLCKIQEHCIEIIPREEQIFYLRVARKVAKHFVDNQLPQLIIYSKRMFDDKRIEHLRVRRLLIEVLQSIEC